MLCSGEPNVELERLVQVDHLESGRSWKHYQKLATRVYRHPASLTADDYDFLESTTSDQMNSMPVVLKADLFLAVYQSKKLLAETARQIQQSASAGERRVRLDAQRSTMRRQHTILHNFLKRLIMSGLNDFRAHAPLWEVVSDELDVIRPRLVRRIKQEFQIPEDTPQLREFEIDNTNVASQRCRRRLIHVAAAVIIGGLMEIAARASTNLEVPTWLAFYWVIASSVYYLLFLGPGTAGEFASGLGYRWP